MISRCRDCGRETSSEMAFCPSCGAECMAVTEHGSRYSLMAVLLALAALAAAIIYAKYVS